MFKMFLIIIEYIFYFIILVYFQLVNIGFVGRICPITIVKISVKLCLIILMV